jgi:hypothetical protein
MLYKKVFDLADYLLNRVRTEQYSSVFRVVDGGEQFLEYNMGSLLCLKISLDHNYAMICPFVHLDIDEEELREFEKRDSKKALMNKRMRLLEEIEKINKQLGEL